MSNRRNESHASLGEFVAAKGLKKNRVAADLGISPQFFSMLLQPNIYRPRVDAALAERIAGLLNQPVTYVRKLYPREAA